MERMIKKRRNSNSLLIIGGKNKELGRNWFRSLIGEVLFWEM